MDNIPTALIILALAGLIYLGAWAWEFHKWRRKLHTAMVKKPITSIDTDSTARKRDRRTLHESMKRRKEA